MDEADIGATRIPQPDRCGYHVALDDLVLRITIRNTFDRENRGQPWANDIIEAFNQALQRVEVDFTHTTIVSSTVFAGLVQLYQGLHERSRDGIHLTQVGGQVLHSLQMLKLDALFTIHRRETTGD